MEELCVRTETRSPEETFRLGRAVGEFLVAGDVVALVGELGAGKTTIARGIACGLGYADWNRVNSPTYVLEQVYPGRLSIHHYDAYRISGEEEFLLLGFEEHLDEDMQAVCLVEWADRVAPSLPPDRLLLSLEHDPASPERRSVLLAGSGSRWELRFARLDLDRVHRPGELAGES